MTISNRSLAIRTATLFVRMMSISSWLRFLGPIPDLARSKAMMWRVLDAGASDLLHWPELPTRADDVACRLQRWWDIQHLIDSPLVRTMVAGQSAAWRAMLREVAEAAHFTQAPVLITGETGTGKEQIAHVIHELDGRRERGEFVVLDCTTVSPELSGSEFFGHERGAFTGATGPRDGAFALANGGMLFLDEVGELACRCRRSCSVWCRSINTNAWVATAGSTASFGWLRHAPQSGDGDRRRQLSRRLVLPDCRFSLHDPRVA